MHPAVPAAWRGTQLVTAGLIFDWQTDDRARRRQAQVHVEVQGAAKTLNALEKVVKAVKGAREGTQLIVFGIVVIVIGAPIVGAGSL